MSTTTAATFTAARFCFGSNLGFLGADVGFLNLCRVTQWAAYGSIEFPTADGDAVKNVVTYAARQLIKSHQ